MGTTDGAEVPRPLSPADGALDDIDREILRQRARALAATIEQADPRQTSIPLLEFKMMGARFAVPLAVVDAVTRIGDILPIPLTPRHITGVIHRRGETIALVSPRLFFHPDAGGIADADFAVIVRGRGKRFALQVEEVVGVKLEPADGFAPPSENYDPAQAPFVSGVSVGGLSLIDPDRLVVAEGFAAGRRPR